MSSDLWLSLVVAAFVVYRVARMLAIEEGPFELFLSLRGLIYEKYPKQWIANGVTCPVCLSFWTALPVAVVLTLQLHLEWYAILWLWPALSGIATFLYKLEQ